MLPRRKYPINRSCDSLSFSLGLVSSLFILWLAGNLSLENASGTPSISVLLEVNLALCQRSADVGLQPRCRQYCFDVCRTGFGVRQI